MPGFSFSKEFKECPVAGRWGAVGDQVGQAMVRRRGCNSTRRLEGVWL